MRKRYLAYAGILTAIPALINYMTALQTEQLAFGLMSYGGEYVCCRGFGVMLRKFYPLTAMGDPIQSHSVISLDLLSLTVSYLLILLGVCLIGLCIRRMRARSGSKVSKNKFKWG